MTDLSVIIVNYNVKEFLANSVKSILKSASSLKCEIIVVDNASADGSVEYISSLFPQIIVIANADNLGFGAANNQALGIAKGKFIALINPDTIVKEDTFTKLIEFFAENPTAGIAGCRVLNPDGTLQLACRRSFPGPWVSFTKISGLSSLFPKSRLFARYNLTYLDEFKTYEVDAISGSFMFIRREVYEKTKGFDPDFFMYGEDLDLCFRAKDAGYGVYYLHTTEIIHYKGESTRRSSIDENKIFHKAMEIFVDKHISGSILVKLILRAAIFARRMASLLRTYSLIVFSSILDFILFSGSVALGEFLYRPSDWVGFPDNVKPWVYLIPGISQTAISFFTGTYTKNKISVWKAVLSLFYGFLFLSAFTFFFKQFGYSRGVFLISYTFAFLLFALWRTVAKLFFRIGVDHGKLGNKTIIAGTGKKAEILAEKLRSNSASIHKIEGFASLTPEVIGTTKGGAEVLCTLENLHKIIKERNISLVIFSSEEIPFEKMFEVLGRSQGLNVEFKVVGNEMEYLVGKSSVTVLENIPFMKLSLNITEISHKISKTVFDKTISLTLLILVFPFVYLLSKCGKKGKLIHMLLQIPEILLGSKSLVGPRVAPSGTGTYLGKEGITGLWFIEAGRISDEEENKLNIYYARNQSIWLDLEILSKTIRIILNRG